MKILRLFSVIAIMFLCGNLFAGVKQVGDKYQLVYEILDDSGNFVSGQTVALKIKKSSNGFFLDFSDSTFKNSGWSQQTTNLTEDAVNGFYYYTFTPPVSEILEDSYQFLISNADTEYKDHQSYVVDYLPDYESLIRRHGR